MDTTGAAHDTEVLRAPLVIEYPFVRTTGPVIGAFLTGLRERTLVGIRGTDGRVIVPPVEYDPVTAQDLTELVVVGPASVVTACAWVPEPRPEHPLDHPFAWALIRPDGADTAMVHVVDAPGPADVRIGSRVTPHWADETVGAITDIAWFDLEETA